MKRINLRRRDYIGIFLILIIGCYFLYLNSQVRALETELKEYQFNNGAQLEEGHGENETITLYFSDSNAMYLVGEKRAIKDLTPQKALQALIQGPKTKGFGRTLPRELEVKYVQIENGVAHIYLHESIPLKEHGNYSSSAATSSFIGSICNTLILHRPFGIEKVILEGQEIQELLNQVIIKDRQLGVNMDLIKK